MGLCPYRGGTHLVGHLGGVTPQELLIPFLIARPHYSPPGRQSPRSAGFKATESFFPAVSISRDCFYVSLRSILNRCVEQGNTAVVIMRASYQETISGEGVSRAKANFQRIKWGPVENPSHDLGTDLFVQARDTRGFSRGLVIGVQVKTGPSYFGRPRYREGQIEGWWYREPNRRHFEEWTARCLPHLLVLHDLDQDISYWVQVTADAVMSTGQGCKILVPKAQTIDPKHIDDLYAVACQQRAAPVLEGTSFHGLEGGVPPARLLRYALVAPRLMAPNPNAGHDTPISAAQGLALLAQGRFRSLKTFADEHPDDVTDPVGYGGSDWTWQFVCSMWDWAMTDSVDRLRNVSGSAPTEDAKAASGVLLACALQRLSKHSQPRGARR